MKLSRNMRDFISVQKRAYGGCWNAYWPQEQRTIDALVRRGLVESRQGLTDREARLTPAGMAVL